MTIWFDMDGTLADFYGVEGWLDYLQAENTTPYAQAKVLQDMNYLAKLLNKAQRHGHKLGIISWLSKTGSAAFNEEVITAKLNWLAKHLGSVHFDEIHIVKYGTPKQSFAHSPLDILFDDEKRNRDNWEGFSYTPNEIISVMKCF